MNSKKLKRLLIEAVTALDNVESGQRHPRCVVAHTGVAFGSESPSPQCQCAELYARDAVGMISIKLGGRSVIDSWKNR